MADQIKIMKTLKTDHIARIEGKAGLEIEVINNKIQDIKVNVVEGPRFFEAITIGKPLEEAISVYPRICSFCSAAHKITAIQAAEAALGLEPTDQTKKLRELMYIGDHIESHTLHLYLLSLPDFLNYPSAMDMAKDYPAIISDALILKDIGADIQKIIGSRYIHQENALVGGFGKLPSKDTLVKLVQTLESFKKLPENALKAFSRHSLWPEAARERVHLALKPYTDYGIFGDTIMINNGKSFLINHYKHNLIEKVENHSFAKHYFYNNHSFMTGALSRITLFGDKLFGRAKELFNSHKEFLDPANPLSNNYAQAIELVYFLEKAHMLAEDLASTINENEPRIKPSFKNIKNNSIGISVTEAPRGLLIYTLGVDKKGIITTSDIITPTAMFLAIIEEDVKQLAHALSQKETTGQKLESISHKLEIIVRSYDPCISCSVH
ncbi:nickel-dependent hydrogenase large subunit [Candidatus Hodarchaeum mangrovi]